jgi:hypothetical protein
MVSIGAWVLVGPWLLVKVLALERWARGLGEVKLSEITPPPNKKHRDREKIRQIAVIAMV